MQIRQDPLPSSSDVEAAASTQLPGEKKRRPLKPATLPAHSCAAAAQRLSELPEQPLRGTYYPVAHLRPYPTGWRTKRHIKRKHLPFSALSYLASERHSQWALLSLAFGALAVIVILSGVLVGFTA